MNFFLIGVVSGKIFLVFLRVSAAKFRRSLFRCQAMPAMARDLSRRAVDVGDSFSPNL
jgi:hypothetical protein